MIMLVNVQVERVKTLLGKGYNENVGVLLTPPGIKNVEMKELIESGLPWAADNGAFSGFSPIKFKQLLKTVQGQPGCLFVACPDVVGDAKATLELFNQWQGEIEYAELPTALVLQDGQENLLLPDADAYFVGGSTRFKLSRSATDLIVECKRRNKWVHMGRVNSMRRIKHAHKREVDSIDGTRYRFQGFNTVRTFCEYMSLLDTYKRIRANGKHL